MSVFTKKKNTKIRDTAGDRALQIGTSAFLLLILIIVGYPLIYIVSCSFSHSEALSSGRVLLWPVDFSLKGYEFVFQFDRVWVGYKNTIFYTVVGVCLTMFMQIMMAYPLSKDYYQGKGFVLKLLLIAMMISAGLIPTYILKMNLGMVNTVWAIILSGILGIQNVFMLRNSFKHSIPGELFDAARIDGANDFQCLVQLAIPLAKATISVLALYSAVGCWNSYFDAMIYLPGRQDLWPLQLFLRNLLVSSSGLEAGAVEGMSTSVQQAYQDSGIEQIKYCLIVISTVPVLLMYAVVQRYFEKGVMVGSVKG